ncbi:MULTISPECIES: fimbrial biogenesis chaperone [Sphingobium]|uniref:Pili assembly chaperone N-terminal domain-containing protein n=1 Tax=Sphingobium baderi LL03 TaxID=1114964 RepID=T0GQ56_9SPHN|nr:MULTISPECIES: fimbria/pilus periplasmic chaperone [Sphingobium]AMK26300.1 P pilus assembly protein chaperone PapD-like protein [Sphingobium sp. TKS]EQB02123.1 hypothetical protein L485_08915 [Sphingobium baderi LL03]KMS59081.1 hypothetical protein V475_21205 [Sphingobium baderi LL03]
MQEQSVKRLSLLGMVVAGMVAAMPARAQELGISPVRVEMMGDARAATLTVRNTSDAPVNLQVRAMDWQQVEGAERFKPTEMLMASPPITSLGPGETQVVRLVADGLPPTAVEKAFRLVLDQIPSVAPLEGAGMRIQLRVLVPVFVLPKGNLRPMLHWSARREGESLILTVVNDGARHDRLLNLKVTTGAGVPIAIPSTNTGYVLSGGSQSWTVRTALAGIRSLRISGDGEFGGISADVPIVP